MRSGFCAQAALAAIIVNAKMPVVSFIEFPYLLTGVAACPGLPDVLATGSMSWLKNVVAVQVATTLSLGAYWYVCLALASPGLRVEATSRLDTFTIRSSLPTRSKKPSTAQNGPS